MGTIKGRINEIIQRRMARGIGESDNDFLRTMMGANPEGEGCDSDGNGDDGGGNHAEARKGPQNKHANAPGSTLVIDNMVTMVWAGHDTTAAALSFTLKLMADHQDVQAKLEAELKAITDKNGRQCDETVADALTVEDIKTAPYLNAVRMRTSVHSNKARTRSNFNLCFLFVFCVFVVFFFFLFSPCFGVIGFT